MTITLPAGRLLGSVRRCENHMPIVVVSRCGANADIQPDMHCCVAIGLPLRAVEYACDQYGYADAPYKSASKGNAVRFKAETESAKYSKLRWSGFIRGEKLDATVMMKETGLLGTISGTAAGLQRPRFQPSGAIQQLCANRDLAGNVRCGQSGRDLLASK